MTFLKVTPLPGFRIDVEDGKMTLYALVDGELQEKPSGTDPTSIPIKHDQKRYAIVIPVGEEVFVYGPYMSYDEARKATHHAILFSRWTIVEMEML